MKRQLAAGTRRIGTRRIGEWRAQILSRSYSYFCSRSRIKHLTEGGLQAVWLDSSVGRAMHRGYLEGPIQAGIFFAGSLHNSCSSNAYVAYIQVTSITMFHIYNEFTQ